MKPQRDVDFHAPDSMETIPFGASFPAGHLVNPNSGYRTFAPKFNHEQCIRCLFCFVYCPEGAICKDGEQLTVDMDYCKGCGICAHECPKKCIEMVKEAEYGWVRKHFCLPMRLRPTAFGWQSPR